MAVPARRTSKTKKRMRRTHIKKDAPTIITCPECNAPIQPHRVCGKCGYYKGKNVVETNKEETQTKEKDTKKKSKKKETKSAE